MAHKEDFELEDIHWAMGQVIETKNYCGDDCSNPKLLQNLNEKIDLKDGITTRDGTPLLLDKNPYQLLQDKYLHEYFKLCTYAEGGLFPVAGGSLDQPTEFLEFYEMYLYWKNINKIEAKK